MIKVSVIYPAGDGTTFDMEYYRTTHMDIVEKVMPGLQRIEIDEFVGGPNLAAGHLYFESMEALGAAMAAPEAGQAAADVPNFTNAEPTYQTATIIER